MISMNMTVTMYVKFAGNHNHNLLPFNKAS